MDDDTVPELPDLGKWRRVEPGSRKPTIEGVNLTNSQAPTSRCMQCIADVNGVGAETAAERNRDVIIRHARRMDILPTNEADQSLNNLISRQLIGIAPQNMPCLEQG